VSGYRRAFITGAEGFIGRTLAQRLRDQGVEVTGVDFKPSHPEVVAGDVGEDGNWLEAVEGCDLVIHTAALVQMAGDRERFYEVNVAGAKRVMDAAKQAGAKRFVHFSSTAIYSDKFPPNVTEDHPPRISGNLYVDTKIAAEQVVFQEHSASDFPVTVIRPGDVYGPGSRPWTTEPVQMLKRRQFVLPGNGKGIFSPIYLDDLIDGVLIAAEHDDGVGQAFNISCREGVTNKEFFGHYARMLGVPMPCLPTAVVLPLAAVGYRARRVLPVSADMNVPTVRFMLRTGAHSSEKAKRVLGWEPEINLDDGMSRTEQWLREQQLI
jgi:nucleoside-diphosphate-sugar epimerase